MRSQLVAQRRGRELDVLSHLDESGGHFFAKLLNRITELRLRGEISAKLRQPLTELRFRGELSAKLRQPLTELRFRRELSAKLRQPLTEHRFRGELGAKVRQVLSKLSPRGRSIEVRHVVRRAAILPSAFARCTARARS